jgi:hypothetical protein
VHGPVYQRDRVKAGERNDPPHPRRAIDQEVAGRCLVL